MVNIQLFHKIAKTNFSREFGTLISVLCKIDSNKNQRSKLIMLKLSPVYKLLVFICNVVDVGGDGSYETDLNQFLRSFEQTYFA